MTDRTTAHDRLIIFTRYPEPGKAKTRLIPALGAIGAAAIHRQMTEHTLMQARMLLASQSVTVDVQFAEGDCERMADWLGADLNYQVQASGDLGERMAHAFETAFAAGSTAVVIIGTDCPQLDVDLLAKAFGELRQHDLVLGPAVDGGYYLIGLRRPIPELFRGIAWSTADVLAQTLVIAHQRSLRVCHLPTLADVDYPADLEVWEQVNAQRQSNRPTARPLISVIIPVLNEADHLAQTLNGLRSAANVEVIVVDGGSQDQTVAIAQSHGVRTVSTVPGRAHQMNVGAAVAQGDSLLFLHGDTWLPSGFETLIPSALAQPGVVAGAFRLQIRGKNWGLRVVEWSVNWRSRWLQLPYGDQAIFLKAATFQALGGFPALPIMEDFELVRRLQPQGRILIVPTAVLTSDRRWQKFGIIRTTLVHQLVILAYFLGVDPDRIARWYRRQR